MGTNKVAESLRHNSGIPHQNLKRTQWHETYCDHFVFCCHVWNEHRFRHILLCVAFECLAVLQVLDLQQQSCVHMDICAKVIIILRLSQ